ncbi:transcription repressor OFP14 [Malania oleifera]|uniref:transcription repressor OFP14 n=1 Tax=Malania oleifera TaxID=397392 RepID=UPI0025AE8D70|nr:transcription repressor OFP14 [Malania oleifera]
MPKKHFQKSIQLYLSKLKKPNPHNPFPSNPTAKILAGCRFPKTPSFAYRHHAAEPSAASPSDGHAATLSDVDRFLFENFKSLYPNENGDESPHGPPARPTDSKDAVFGSDPFALGDPAAEVARLSLTSTEEEARSSSSSGSSSIAGAGQRRDGLALADDCIAVLRYSATPYEDFRRSMENIMEARFREERKVEWDFMEELLFGYLNLNERKSYKYILSAFVDLVVVLRQNSGKLQPSTAAGGSRNKKGDVT